MNGIFTNDVKYKDFFYWFRYEGPNTFAIYHVVSDTWYSVGTLKELVPGGKVEVTLDKDVTDPEGREVIILNDFDKFRSKRPEYLLGSTLSYVVSDPGTNSNLYLNYLMGAVLARTWYNVFSGKLEDAEIIDRVYDKIYPCIEWLDYSTDFFTAPASTVFHESKVGGLCEHTLKVVYHVEDLLRCRTFGFSRIRIEDAILCALIHDWCKIGVYESYTKNVKNNKTGKWEAVDGFKRKDQFLTCFGHGVSSVMLAQRFFKLSIEECLAVRWHQGRWNVCREELNELQQANENYPLVHLIQFADQLAITNYR